MRGLSTTKRATQLLQVGMEGWLRRSLMLAFVEFYSTEHWWPVKFVSSWRSDKCCRNANDQIFVKSAGYVIFNRQSSFGEMGPQHNDNWHMAGQILDSISVFHHLCTLPAFKLCICTVVKNFALNKRMHSRDVPQSLSTPLVLPDHEMTWLINSCS